MACFYSVLGFLSTNSFDISKPGSFDIISILPFEVASTILRLLPAKDLLNAACVSKTWMKICKSDIKLRKKLRLHLRRMRKARLLTLIREDIGGRRVAERPVQRTAMHSIVNYPVNMKPSTGIEFICRDSRSQLRYTPYFGRRATKINSANEKTQKTHLRM